MFRLTGYRIMICLAMIMMAGKQLRAQHTHFIYFQHENSASFYVKHEGQIIRSSPQGYLILSKLPKGKQVFFIGQNEADQSLLEFRIDSLDRDKGFLIKNLSVSGWALFDLQTSAVLNPSNELAKTDKSDGKQITAGSVNDPFGNMLADVTKDSTVKYVALPEKPVLKDTIQAKKPDISKQTELKKTDSVVVQTVKVKRSDVIIFNRRENDTSYLYSFAVSLFKKSDTVLVQIDKSSAFPDHTDIVIPENIIIPDSGIKKIDKSVVTPDTSNISKKELVVDTLVIIPLKVEEMETVKIVDVSSDSILVKQEVSPKETNNHCKKTASEDDFIRLRKKMAGQRTEEKMMDEALRVFRVMCFTSGQIGQLSVFFLSDEMKYRFFDSAVKYVSDLREFPILGNQIRDPYYRKRFDALMPNP